MFTIKVISEETGSPIKDAKVGIIFDGFFGRVTQDIYTDLNGEAHFDYNNGNGKVYVTAPWGFFSTSECLFEGFIKGRIVVYLK